LQGLKPGREDGPATRVPVPVHWKDCGGVEHTGVAQVHGPLRAGDPGAKLRGLGTGMGIDRTALERATTLALTNWTGRRNRA
jgi:hypothetical protein